MRFYSECQKLEKRFVNSQEFAEFCWHGKINSRKVSLNCRMLHQIIKNMPNDIIEFYFQSY